MPNITTNHAITCIDKSARTSMTPVNFYLNVQKALGGS